MTTAPTSVPLWTAAPVSVCAGAAGGVGRADARGLSARHKLPGHLLCAGAGCSEGWPWLVDGVPEPTAGPPERPELESWSPGPWTESLGCCEVLLAPSWRRLPWGVAGAEAEPQNMATLGDICRQQAVELPDRDIPRPTLGPPPDPVSPSGKDALLRPERPSGLGCLSLLDFVLAPLHPYMCSQVRVSP